MIAAVFDVDRDVLFLSTGGGSFTFGELISCRRGAYFGDILGRIFCQRAVICCGRLVCGEVAKRVGSFSRSFVCVFCGRVVAVLADEVSPYPGSERRGASWVRLGRLASE